MPDILTAEDKLLLLSVTTSKRYGCQLACSHLVHVRLPLMLTLLPPAQLTAKRPLCCVELTARGRFEQPVCMVEVLLVNSSCSKQVTR